MVGAETVEYDAQTEYCVRHAGMASVHLGAFIGGVGFLGDLSNLGMDHVVFLFFAFCLDSSPIQFLD